MWVLRPYFLTKLGNIDFSSPDPKGHERYWHPSSSVNFYILIFFSGTKLECSWDGHLAFTVSEIGED